MASAASRDGHVRIDLYDDDGAVVFTEAIGPDGGWQLRQGGTEAEDLSGEGENALRRGLDRNLCTACTSSRRSVTGCIPTAR